MAPRARLDDGLLDVVRIPELGFWQQALSMRTPAQRRLRR